MKLYEYSTTRSVRSHWILREVGLEYETETVDLSRGEGQRPEFLRLNPFGRIPVLDDNGFIVFESAAIATYLADKKPELGLMPPVGSQERALCYQWLFLAVSEIESPLWFAAKNRFLYPEELRSGEVPEICRFDFERVMAPFEKAIRGRKYLVGDRFTVADLMMSHILFWSHYMGWLKEHENAAQYMQRHVNREAFPRFLFEES